MYPERAALDLNPRTKAGAARIQEILDVEQHRCQARTCITAEAILQEIEDAERTLKKLHTKLSEAEGTELEIRTHEASSSWGVGFTRVKIIRAARSWRVTSIVRDHGSGGRYLTIELGPHTPTMQEIGERDGYEGAAAEKRGRSLYYWNIFRR